MPGFALHRLGMVNEITRLKTLRIDGDSSGHVFIFHRQIFHNM